ncbi:MULTISPECIES: altronate dehydratase family protein [unclassified Lysinibacillus]|uniref:UxaA family hydrolase n=1 Tax=unclassified Lysinibacillus TaxID=2636778 RepID=UPI002010E2CE|nr:MULTISPECIES: altronate dehydratase family protein [unclassified Lysinibacillus]MCL1696843.1 altronate dehydratase family protein [Lysinibacillus sp. BPa_S21]MCL1701499.1 altronate dehydratase family protein [Lysinibacillus sp. Bpr_S20]
MNNQSFIKIHPMDNVAIALSDLPQGFLLPLDGTEITLQQQVQRGHKIAITTLSNDEHIMKYGFPIGHATKEIPAGSWVHSHNMKTNLSGELSYEFKPKAHPVATSRHAQRTFKGYRRTDGQVGVRNEIWLINTVGCINKVAENLAKLGNQLLNADNFDGVQHFAHPYGCSQLGDDLTYTQKILANLIHHPNAGAVIVLGLGCENNYIELFKKTIGHYDEHRVAFLNIQESADEMEEGQRLLEKAFEYATTFERQEVSISELKIGLKCGGSDGFSGITANPMIGVFSDQLISAGGATVLTEVPEMFGAEQILMERAKDASVFRDIVHLVNDFKQYFIKYNQPIYENPSPGNKEGGITTLEEKSLGCIQKGGFQEVKEVLDYGDRMTTKGLHLLNGPGNDLVSTTALASTGCQIVLFSTGRGTPFGGPTPTVKISTNTPLYERKKNWIDFNAGQLVEGKPINVLVDEFMDYILALASGEVHTNNEKYGFKEIAIFKDGVTM